MAGGRFEGQNKIRPGVYINFKSVPRPTITIGDRGIATIGLKLAWGDNEKLIDVYSTDLLDGTSLNTIGFTAFDAASKLLNPILSECYLCRVFNLNSGGVKATGSLGGISMTAKWPGTLGNQITVVSEVMTTPGVFKITTFVRGEPRSVQVVSSAAGLEDNAFVVFAKTGTLSASAGIALAGGTDGTFSAARYTVYLNLLKTARWNIMACPESDAPTKAVVAAFVEAMRDGEGRYVQVVIGNYNTPDYEGVISNKNTVRMDDVEFSVDEATAIVAGLQGGARITESLTGRIVRGATTIVGEMTNTEIETALNQGFIVFTANQNGSIRIEQDINTLQTFTMEKNRFFRKNRVIRTLDQIGTDITDLWELSYMGKVSNNDNGRSIFRAEIIGYLKDLDNRGAITNFDGATDVEVMRGIDLDTVICNLWIQPVDSMEKLYLTVNIVG
jgi:hypothetical protein